MIKVLQYFLLDYLLDRLDVHPAATAYSHGSSIRKNAEVHTRKKYVANIDVSDFFPSLTTDVVIKSLLAAGLKNNTATLVARLSSYKGGLPQGAPTSAALSNIAMYEFDKEVSGACQSLGVDYTRYADDMTFSGMDLDAVKKGIALAKKSLAAMGLKINDEKTRIYGPSTRQVVTGVVVNDWPQPSREERRRLRAELHRAKTTPEDFVDKYQQLQGRSAYMLSYAREERPIGAISRKYVEDALISVNKLRPSIRK
jgi:retron-type reverse transcriptase